jgi:hypothetical protein
MMIKKYLFIVLFFMTNTLLFAQIEEDEFTPKQIDSLYIVDFESDARGKDKVLHAEPLYIDLIRDLGARKGEKEWNIGVGMTDNLRYDSYEALIEYEFAPIDRLGLEIELPFTFNSSHKDISKDSIPSSSMESLKLAGQWSFFVSEKIATSMAIGYINEFEFSDFRNFGNPLIKGNVYNPFFIVAKRWGTNFHTLVYTGPMIEQDFKTNHFHTTFDINTNIHYMITGTRNFVGVEFNKTIDEGDFQMTIRPQMRVGVTNNLIIGIVGGIPVNRETNRLSTFVRIIWEPGH